MDYQEYLNTDHWKEKRQEALEEYGYSCVLCGSGPNLEVHHRNYFNLWRENITKDLIVLCDKCHEKYSIEEDSIKEFSLLEYVFMGLTAAWDE